jgi:hypothetical protein
VAATDANPMPVKNKAWRVTFPILDADGDLVTGATGLDSEVSKDQGTFADCTNEATEIATASGMYYLDLTATEMNADTVAIIVKTTSSGAKTTVLVCYPFAIAELSAAPAFGAAGMSVEDALSWLVAQMRNKVTQTASTTTLFKDDGSTTLSTSAVTDDNTTLTRGEFT